MTETAVPEKPLRALLPAIHPAAQRWTDLARSSGWTARVGRQWAPVVRHEGAVISRPAHFSLTGGGAELRVAVDSAQWPELACLQEIEDQARRDAAARIVLSDLLETLRQVGSPVEGCRVPAAGELPAPEQARVALRVGHLDVDLFPDAQSHALAPTVGDLPGVPGPVGAAIAAWVLGTRLVIGRRKLRRDSLLALRKGDVVLGGMDGQARLEIVSGGDTRVFATGRLNDEGHMIMNEALHEEFSPDDADDMDDDFMDSLDADDDLHDDEFHDDDFPDDGLAPGGKGSAGLQETLARLPMPVRYEIAGPQLTVSRACALAQGDVLTLPVSAQNAVVRLVCQGRTVAVGELVCIGEQLGVRITSTGAGDV